MKLKKIFFLLPLLLVLANCGGGGSDSGSSDSQKEDLTLKQSNKQFNVTIADINITSEEQNKKVVINGQVKKVGQATLIVAEIVAE